MDAIKGDYVNLHITADLDLAGIYGNLTDEPGGGRGGDGPPQGPGLPEIPGLPDVPDLPDLPDVPDVPGVPTPTGLPSRPSVPSPSAPSGGGGDPLCPPVCTAAHAAEGDWPEGIDLELAELMLKGVQP